VKIVKEYFIWDENSPKGNIGSFELLSVNEDNKTWGVVFDTLHD